MSQSEGLQGEQRHRSLDEVRAARLATMTAEERAEFEEAYEAQRRRLEGATRLG